MKLAQSPHTNEVQDLATATIAPIPTNKMTTELKNWCAAHNAHPDRIVLSPSNKGDYFFAYGGDALYLAEHTGIKAYETFYNDVEIEVAIVNSEDLEQLAADLSPLGIELYMAIEVFA